MQIGIKCFPLEYPENIATKIEKVKGYDYIEIYTTPEFREKSAKKTDVEKLAEFRDRKILAVHAAHTNGGCNFAYCSRANREALSIAQKAADLLGSRFIIVHPGYIESGRQEEADLVYAADFLRDIDDKRILVENVPFMEETRRLIFPYIFPKDIRKFNQNAGYEACMDVLHAAANAVQSRQDVLKYLLEMYYMFQPEYFHIADMKDAHSDEMLDVHDHMHLGTGVLPLEEIIKLLKDKDVYLTIETNDLNQEDIDFVRRIRDK